MLKGIEYLHHQFFFFFFFCKYKMYLILAKEHKNADAHILIIKKTGKIWPGMKDPGSGMGAKNISDLILKEMHGILKTKNPTKE